MLLFSVKQTQILLSLVNEQYLTEVYTKTLSFLCAITVFNTLKFIHIQTDKIKSFIHLSLRITTVCHVYHLHSLKIRHFLFYFCHPPHATHIIHATQIPNIKRLPNAPHLHDPFRACYTIFLPFTFPLLDIHREKATASSHSPILFLSDR